MGSCIYVLVFQIHLYAASPYMQPSFGFMLICLLVLHVYWQYLMIGILLNYATKGVAEDTVNNIRYSHQRAKEEGENGGKKSD